MLLPFRISAEMGLIEWDCRISTYRLVGPWANLGLFLFILVLFCLIPTSITITNIQIEKSVDGVHGNRTSGYRMVGTDETTELWRPWWQ